nr:hypothetical protein Iba_chr05bCG6990 [Ipomoea batatas]
MRRLKQPVAGLKWKMIDLRMSWPYLVVTDRLTVSRQHAHDMDDSIAIASYHRQVATFMGKKEGIRQKEIRIKRCKGTMGSRVSTINLVDEGKPNGKPPKERETGKPSPPSFTASGSVTAPTLSPLVVPSGRNANPTAAKPAVVADRRIRHHRSKDPSSLASAVAAAIAGHRSAIRRCPHQQIVAGKPSLATAFSPPSSVVASSVLPENQLRRSNRDRIPSPELHCRILILERR